MTSQATSTGDSSLPVARQRSSTIHGHSRQSATGLGLAALGIVFGDIGTSPLYVLKTVVAATGGRSDAETILGIMSLLFWTLVVVATAKYVAVVMNLDNDGEGGILALMSLVGFRKPRPVIVAAGLFGAALIYGDGALTPAISVLSALEGLNMATPKVAPYVLPAAVAILVALFAAQPLGTERIGRAFGPVMAAWFLAIALLGIGGIAHHPSVLAALDPSHAVRLLASGGWTGFAILGGVFLCVTGAEALYADMGHFGPRPIRTSWLLVVFPSLVLNYAGQAALLLEGAPTDGNTFYQLCPAWLLVPLVCLATLATVIASQAIITGAFSMTRQAMQLGWLPRMAVKQTSSEGYGQIYIGPVNWLLMVATVSLTLAFRRSDSLTSAYGIAVSLTMLITTALLFLALREVRHWGVLAAGSVTAVFLVVETAFAGANLAKVADGGYVPLLIACAAFATMQLWHRGTAAVRQRIGETALPFDEFKARVHAGQTPRVPGTAVFLTFQDFDVPAIVAWHLLRTKSLHEDVVVLSVGGATVPWIRGNDERMEVKALAPRFWRVHARFGFMEHPDVPRLIEQLEARGVKAGMADVTYYVGHAVTVHRTDGNGLPHMVQEAYALLSRNSMHISDFLNLPQDQTMELGRQVAI